MTEELEERGQCKLFGDFGIIVQLILGGISFMVLVLKRILEHPKRSWKIWTLDASKQAFSALLAHFLNLVLAVLLSKQNSNDACVWYFINIMLDTTIGVIMCYLTLKLVERIANHYGSRTFHTGEYYQPKTGEIDYRVWTIQFLVWGGIVSFSKVVLFGLQSIKPSALEAIGDVLLSWISDPDVELVVVMIFVPIIMNMIQFWVQDNFLKGKVTATEENAREKETPVGYNEQPKPDAREVNVIVNMPPYTGPEIEVKA